MIVQGLLASIKKNSTLLNKLKAYYKLDSNSNDSLGLNNGTDTGTPSYATGGKIGNGVTYNGTSQYTTFPNSAIFKSTASSIGFWVKKLSNPSSGESALYASTNFTGGVASGWWINLTTTGALTINFWNGINAISIGGPVGYTLDTNLHFILVDISGNSCNVYVDDMVTPKYTNGATALGWSASTNRPSIGAMNFSGSFQNFANILLDELGVFDNLTESERQELYNSGAGKTHPF